MHGWFVYLLMPLVGAAIGYLTKLVAIEMMFRPARFIGIPPWLGWQGVVPRSADRMVRVSADLLTRKLIDPRDILARIDPVALEAQIEQPLLALIDEITRDVLRQYHPRMWEVLPMLAQDMIVKQVQAAAPAIVEQVIAELRADAVDILDVRALAASSLRRDDELMPRLVRELSRPEMAFIARCGLWFGLLLGLVQTVVWGLMQQAWVLPVFGALIGWLTDWLAIKLVFFPRAPYRVLGVTVQGVFQRRRDKVAIQYGELVAREVITVPALVDGVLHGPRSGRITTLIERVVERVVDEQVRIAGPAASLAVGPARLTEIKRAAASEAVRRLPATARHAEPYMLRAMDVARTITARMRKLNRIEYEALLRPAFRQDEWKLLAVGALIGALVGGLQALILP